MLTGQIQIHLYEEQCRHGKILKLVCILADPDLQHWVRGNKEIATSAECSQKYFASNLTTWNQYRSVLALDTDPNGSENFAQIRNLVIERGIFSLRKKTSNKAET